MRAHLDVPEAVCELATRLEEAGYETWAVGGAVRDALLGHPRADWDLATAARPGTVRELFERSYPVGIEFGTVGVRGSDGLVYEITTFRRDLETDGRHAVVEFADELDEDLARRDFTINAIAYHPLKGVFRDPFDGREDLERRVLRSVGEPRQRFAEDYLRILRGLRFAGRYDLKIESATWEALRNAVDRLPRLSAERIREELLKVLQTARAAPGLRLYEASGAMRVLLPEVLQSVARAADEGSGFVDAVKETIRAAIRAATGDASAGEREWSRLLAAIDSIGPHRFFLRLTMLLSSARSAVEQIMTRLRFSNAEVRRAVQLVEGLAEPLPAPDEAAEVRRWVSNVGRGSVADLLRLHIATVRGASAVGATGAGSRPILLARQARAIRRVLLSHEPVELSDLAIDGHDLRRDLRLEPGPELGRILDACLEHVIEHPDRNTREGLLEFVRGHYR